MRLRIFLILTMSQLCDAQNAACEVCGSGLVVTNLDEPVPLPGQELTCEELQQSGLDGQIPAGQCAAAASFISESCGCAPANSTPTIPPTDGETPSQSTPTDPPSSAPQDDSPTLGPGVNPPCSICGEGLRITLSDPVVAIPNFPVEPTCEEFERAGFDGNIPASNCPLVPSIVFDVCGCAPGEAPVTDPENVCYVCGTQDSRVTNAEAVTDITGESLTCEELETRGLNGSILDDECPFVYMLIANICGCSNENSTQATVPTPSPVSSSSPICLVCGPGNRVGDPTAILTLPDETISCGDLESNGLAGKLTGGDCDSIPQTINSTCRCELNPDAINVTNPDSCLVCDDNMVVRNPNLTIQLAGSDPQTCAELQEEGTRGSVTRADCFVVPSAIRDICGCEELAGSPTDSPVSTQEPSSEEPDCDGSTGTYGIESAIKYDLEFFYEVITTGQSNSSDIERIVTTSLETALSAALFSDVFSEVCSRRLQVHSRRLAVVGLTSKPNDEIQSEVACATNVTDGNACTVIKGLMTLFANDDSDVSETITAALEGARLSMTNGAFDSLDPLLESVRYRTEAVGSPPTPAPGAASECEAAGIIGSDEGVANKVQFYYEVLSTPQTVTSALEGILRITLETALNAALFSGLFSSVCSRRLSARRHLNVIGLTPKPNDELVESLECSIITVLDGNSCTVVEGALTLYAEEGTDITEQKQNTLKRTRVSMANGAFDNLDSRLVQVRYRSDTLNLKSDSNNSNPTATPTKPASVPVWAWTLIGVGIFVVNAVICVFCIRLRRQNKLDEDGDLGFGGDPYGVDDDENDASAYTGQYEGEVEYAQSGYQAADGGDFDLNEKFYNQPNGFSSMGFTSSQPLSGGSGDSFGDEGQQRGGFRNPHDMMNSIGNL